MILNVYDFSKSQSMSVIMCDWSQLVDVGGLFFCVPLNHWTVGYGGYGKQHGHRIQQRDICLFHMAI